MQTSRQIFRNNVTFSIAKSNFVSKNSYKHLDIDEFLEYFFVVALYVNQNQPINWSRIVHFELELRVNSLFLSASHHRKLLLDRHFSPLPIFSCIFSAVAPRSLDLAADIGLDRMVFGQDYKIARFPHNFSLWL